MDREYLEDYEKKEDAERERLLGRRMREGKFNLLKHRYPPDERFWKIQRPVAMASQSLLTFSRLIWAQVPLCGSLVLVLKPLTKSDCYHIGFDIAEIPKIVDFIKETGRLQVVLGAQPTMFKGLDHFRPFFEELSAPALGIPYSILEADKERVKEAEQTFFAVADVKYASFLRSVFPEQIFRNCLTKSFSTYKTLKLTGYPIAGHIENLMIDRPSRALHLIDVCEKFITSPLMDLRCDVHNAPFDLYKEAHSLPPDLQPQDMWFPCEIGTFLLRKLTYVAQDMRACNDLIDSYAAYDLQKVARSLNEAIISNAPDIVTKSVGEFSEILDNVWNDKTIPRRIEGIRIGIPLLIAAIGYVAGGIAGAATSGFLAEFGFKLAEKAADKFFNIKGEGLLEKLAKMRTKSWQANVYDFEMKYKSKIRTD